MASNKKIVETPAIIDQTTSESISSSTTSADQFDLNNFLQNIETEEITLVYFTVGDRDKSEIALVPRNATSEDIKDLFRCSAEAGQYDILKLYTRERRLINISPRIPPNSPTDPYKLEVVAVQCSGILMERVGVDLSSLEKRVSNLETQIKNQCSPSESILGLKSDVNQLRNKLENYEHLSWLGFYKALHPPPAPKPKGSPKGSSDESDQTIDTTKEYSGYHKKSPAHKQAICDKFLKMCDVILTKETCQLLSMVTFDNWQWEEYEMIVLLQQMYLDLELPQKFDIELKVLRNFLVSVYHHYNDVPFHNFRHCFCVTQMMFGLICSLNLSEKIGDLETLILLTSCICHDLDHPGYNNIYQINARTELAIRYNDISPLENHHCSIAFRLLEDNESNIFRNLPSDTFRKVREGMIRCILATDMARHNDIVNQFREIIPYFDPNNRTHVNLLSMILIKVSDISNECRPMEIAEPWLDCLFAEFFQQSDTEKLEGLPVTPFMDRDKVTKPSSQCSFIGLVLLPLFEALGSLFPSLEPLIIQPVRFALDYYRKLNEASQGPQSRHRKSTDVGLQPLMNLKNSSNTTGGSPAGAAKNSKSNSNSNSNLSSDARVPSEPNIHKIQYTVHGQNQSRNTQRAGSICIPGTEYQKQQYRNNTHHPRRASQNVLFHHGINIKNSGSASSLRAKQISTNPSTLPEDDISKFPYLDSDSERESTDDENYEEDEDEITEVAVSERALKFKIATESSFDYSSSRKGSRENRSESSGHSIGHSTSATGRDYERASLGSCLSTPKVEIDIRPPADETPSSNSPVRLTSASASGSCSPSIQKKAPKESFFTRLKLLTERLSMSAESNSGGSDGGSPPVGSTTSFHGFHYFRRSGRKSKNKGQSTPNVVDKDHSCSSSTSKSGVKYLQHKLKHEHGGSISDPEYSGGRTPDLKKKNKNKVKELDDPNVSLISPERSPGVESSCSEDPAGASSGGKSPWKRCSGSLDSILSENEKARIIQKKEEQLKASRSPGTRRLNLPKFSFIRRSRMGSFLRKSPKPSTRSSTSHQQEQS